MAEAAYTMLSASFTASIWAMAGGIAWMLIFNSAIPMIGKLSTIGLMSNEAASRAATLRALSEIRPAAESLRHWN